MIKKVLHRVKARCNVPLQTDVFKVLHRVGARCNVPLQTDLFNDVVHEEANTLNLSKRFKIT